MNSESHAVRATAFQCRTEGKGKDGRAPKVILTPWKFIPVTFQNGVCSLSTYLVKILVQKHHRMRNGLIPAISRNYVAIGNREICLTLGTVETLCPFCCPQTRAQTAYLAMKTFHTLSPSLAVPNSLLCLCSVCSHRDLRRLCCFPNSMWLGASLNSSLSSDCSSFALQVFLRSLYWIKTAQISQKQSQPLIIFSKALEFTVVQQQMM